MTETNVVDGINIWQKWPKFCRFATLCRKAVVDFLADTNSGEGRPDERVARDNVALHEATAISSEIRDPWSFDRDKHLLFLDLDCDHVYLPSSTDGHGHLIINVPMAKAEMLDILAHLAQHGIVEPGFAHAAEIRGAAWLRTPWTEKSWGPVDG